MISRRRRGRRWPWVLALLGLAVMGWMLWPSGTPDAEGESAETARGRTEQPAEQQEVRSATSAQPTEPASTDPPPTDTTGSEQSRDMDEPPTMTVEGSSQLTASVSRPAVSESVAEVPPTEEGEGDSHSDSLEADRDTSQTVRDSSASQAKASDYTDPLASAREAARSAGGDLQRGMDLIADGSFVEGRRVLSRLLYSGQLRAGEARTVRDTLASVNRELVFSDHVDPDDPIATIYEVQSGDLLSRIARSYSVPYQFVMQINGIQDARRVQAGQSIKLIKGPFHAHIDKGDYRMDLSAVGPDGELLYICSFPVGLGEHDSTPPGEWLVAENSKVENPSWRNPRTGERFSSDDPDNPLGGYWLGLTGIDENTRELRGYGIHGTIEPQTIGTQASMGCIRLRDRDIEQVFNMLQEGQSRVTVIP